MCKFFFRKMLASTSGMTTALLMVPSIHVTKKDRPSNDHAPDAMTGTVVDMLSRR
jgi:hypothetical protein